jgi:hypothetical protein
LSKLDKRGIIYAMERGEDGNYRITRDEARLFKTAASLMCRMDLIEVYAHYLGVRKTSPFGPQRPRFDHGVAKGALQEELLNLPLLVERNEAAVNSINYVYTPHLAEESIQTLRTVIASGHLAVEEQVRADQLSTEYNNLHRPRIVA